MKIPGAVTRDSLLRGRVTLFQPARGYRTSLDPIFLGWFLAPPYGHFLDVGAGSGAVSFVLLTRDPLARGLAVELQPQLAQLALRGRDENGFADRLDIRTGDIRDPDGAGTGRFDLIVTNPPFRPEGRGTLPADHERRVAHHEVSLTMADWVDLAARRLAPDGRLGVIIPAARCDELTRALDAHELAPVRRRFTRSEAAAPQNRVLVEAVRARVAGGPCAVEPDLVVHERGGFSSEVRTMLGDPA